MLYMTNTDPSQNSVFKPLVHKNNNYKNCRRNGKTIGNTNGNKKIIAIVLSALLLAPFGAFQLNTKQHDFTKNQNPSANLKA